MQCINMGIVSGNTVVADGSFLPGKEKIKECYYSVAFTEKGAQHVMNLHNGWQEKIEHFNEYAYMEIEKMDTIDSMPVSLDKNGDFVNKN